MLTVLLVQVERGLGSERCFSPSLLGCLWIAGLFEKMWLSPPPPPTLNNCETGVDSSTPLCSSQCA
jgi:hypothetical protein